jgi:hypothetical protein
MVRATGRGRGGVPSRWAHTSDHAPDLTDLSPARRRELTGPHRATSGLSVAQRHELQAALGSLRGHCEAASHVSETGNRFIEIRSHEWGGCIAFTIVRARGETEIRLDDNRGSDEGVEVGRFVSMAGVIEHLRFVLGDLPTT